jgi:hypothetical protein
VVLGGTGGILAEVTPSSIIQGEKGGVLVRVYAIYIVHHDCEVYVNRFVRVVEPLVERGGRLDVVPGARPGVCVHRRAVRSDISALARIESVDAVAFFPHQTFFVVSIRPQRYLEIGAPPPVAVVGITCGSQSIMGALCRALRHCVWCLITKHALNTLRCRLTVHIGYKHK